MTKNLSEFLSGRHSDSVIAEEGGTMTRPATSNLRLTDGHRGKRAWEISLWRSTNLLYRVHVPVGLLSGRKMEQLIATLVAKHGLSDDEIVTSYLNSRARAFTPHLHVNVDVVESKQTTNHNCGTNPFAAVRYVTI
jgi:hypothetical protein